MNYSCVFHIYIFPFMCIFFSHINHNDWCAERIACTIFPLLWSGTFLTVPLVSMSAGDPDEFYYTSQGEAPVVDGIDDRANFEETKEHSSCLVGVQCCMGRGVCMVGGGGDDASYAEGICSRLPVSALLAESCYNAANWHTTEWY